MAKTKAKETKKAVTEETKPKRGRPKKSEAEKEAKPVRRRRRKTDWSSLMENVEEENIVDYKITEDYTETEAIRHKKFGVGVVLKVLAENKIEVVFEDAKKIMAQNWEQQ